VVNWNCPSPTLRTSQTQYWLMGLPIKGTNSWQYFADLHWDTVLCRHSHLSFHNYSTLLPCSAPQTLRRRQFCAMWRHYLSNQLNMAFFLHTVYTDLKLCQLFLECSYVNPILILFRLYPDIYHIIWNKLLILCFIPKHILRKEVNFPNVTVDSNIYESFWVLMAGMIVQAKKSLRI
jgi:hypothetical protein